VKSFLYPYALALGLGFVLAAPVQTLAAETVSTRADGRTLNASLAKTDAWPGGPVALLVHGTLAHGEMEIMASLRDMLQERGISALSVSLSLGIDDRVAAMYDCPTPHRHTHTEAVDEIGAWMSWLKGQGAGPVLLLGHSRGGNQAARYAAAHGSLEPLSAVVLVAPATWDEGRTAESYARRFNQPLEPLLAQARALVEAGKGDELIGPMGFMYCEGTSASARAVVSYYSEDPDMDTPRLLPRIGVPVLVIAGSEDDTIVGLVEKTEPQADGEKVSLSVIDGADHFFRDLYAEEVADLVAELADQ
jgi:pimeloyl-ACP methyl ester carboxylesterase